MSMLTVVTLSNNGSIFSLRLYDDSKEDSHSLTENVLGQCTMILKQTRSVKLVRKIVIVFVLVNFGFLVSE
jgi:hypothetical protein